MKIYHVTSLIERSSGQTDRYTGERLRDHHDLGLYATWKEAVAALLSEKGGLDTAWKGQYICSFNACRVVNDAGKVWINEEGQATRLTLSCPKTSNQWFIEQREVKA